VFEYAEGTYELDNYGVWAEKIPFVKQGIWQRGPEAKPSHSGAYLGVAYRPWVNDFPKWENWIQLVRTDGHWWQMPAYARLVQPGGWGTDYWFVDAPNSARHSPFYNSGGTANYVNFLDVPNQDVSSRGYTFFYLFKCYEPADDPNTLVISQFGISWGYIVR
jgi:hypothetical protein